MTDNDIRRNYTIQITFGALISLVSFLITFGTLIVIVSLWAASIQSKVQTLEDTSDIDDAQDRLIAVLDFQLDNRTSKTLELIQEAASQAEVYVVQEIAASRTDIQSPTSEIANNDTSPHDDEDSELESKLPALDNLSDTAADPLVVKAGETYTAKNTLDRFRSVTLQQNSKLEIPTDFSEWTLNTDKLHVGSGARIVGSGKVGNNGVPGNAGNNGPADCVSGKDGSAGQDGGNGSNGTSITLFVVDLVVDENLEIDTRGGAGGNGGAGGRGGSGGKADRSKRCRGANGGNGGNGGAAGNGGNGGDLELSIRNINGEQIDMSRWGEVIIHEDSPGAAGLGGLGGGGGVGGRGRGKDFFGRSLPGGNAGTEGTNGRLGQAGKRGVSVR